MRLIQLFFSIAMCLSVTLIARAQCTNYPMYGLEYVGGTAGLSRIDPYDANNTVPFSAKIKQFTINSLNQPALNPAGNEYLLNARRLSDNQNILYKFNTATGALMDSFLLSPDSVMYGMVWHCDSNKVYGILANSKRFASMDPNTGHIRLLSPSGLPMAGFELGTNGVLNAEDNRYTIFVRNNNAAHLLHMDLQGTVLSDVTLADSNRVFNLTYNCLNGKYYGIKQSTPLRFAELDVTTGATSSFILQPAPTLSSYNLPYMDMKGLFYSVIVYFDGVNEFFNIVIDVDNEDVTEFTGIGRELTLQATIPRYTCSGAADYTWEGQCSKQAVRFCGTAEAVAYEWDFDDPTSGALNTSTLQSPSHVFQNPGDYDVKLRVFTCKGIDSVTYTLTILDAPITDLGPNITPCPGDSFLLDASYPGATYLWHNGSTDPTFVVSQTGKYWVTLSKNGCTFTDTLNANYRQVPNLGADRQLCAGTSLRLDPGKNAWQSYLWSTGSTDTAITITTGGLYWVQVTISGCVQRDSIDIAFTTLPSFSLGANLTLCPGDSATLGAIHPQATAYLWSTGATTATIKVGTGGNYWCRVCNGICCSRDTVTVTYVPYVGLPTDAVVCSGAPYTFSLPNTGYTYLWDNGSTLNTRSVVANGAYSITISRQGCEWKDTCQITFVPQPSVNLGPDSTLCPGDSVVLRAFHPDADSYLWQNGSTADSLIVKSGGIYSVTVGRGQCYVQDSRIISYYARPSLGADIVLCDGDSATLISNISGADSYLWSTGATGSSIVVDSQGVYAIAVTRNGCTLTDSVFVGIQELPVFSLGVDTTLCAGDSLVLSAAFSGAATLWNTGSVAGTVVIYSEGMIAARNTLNGCLYYDTVHVYFLSGGTTSTQAQACVGDTFMVDKTAANVTYLWSNGHTGPVLSTTDTGSYTLIRDNGRCQQTDVIRLGHVVVPGTTLPHDTSLCSGQVLTLSANVSGANYLWSTGSTDASIQISEAGVVTLLYFVEGCEGRDTVTVSLNSCEVIPPNVFTPNGDGVNDMWVVPGIAFGTWELTVYNRYGALVYSHPNYKNQWTGEGLSDGVYFYYLYSKDRDLAFNGWVMIIR